MSELIVGQMSPDQALLQAKFAAVYQAAKQRIDMMDEELGGLPVTPAWSDEVIDALQSFPEEVIELLTKDPEVDG